VFEKQRSSTGFDGGKRAAWRCSDKDEE